MAQVKDAQSVKGKEPAAPQHKVIRTRKVNPVKQMLRWAYWLVLIGVIGIVLFTSFETGWSLYKGLH